MNTAPEVPKLLPKSPSRTAVAARWTARLLSVPVVALALFAALPGITHFASAGHEDQIVAVGLLGTCVGLLLAWKWELVGGGLALVSFALMMTQEESVSQADPLTLVYGFAGILFVLSGTLSSVGTAPGQDKRIGLKRALLVGLSLLVLAGTAVVWRGQSPTPIPQQQQSFVGRWRDGAGFSLEITPDGRARLEQEAGSKPDPWNSPVTPGKSRALNVYFRDRDTLELPVHWFGTKVYHIDRRPHAEGKQIVMVLNGSDPYSRTNGMRLVKQAGR